MLNQSYVQPVHQGYSGVIAMPDMEQECPVSCGINRVSTDFTSIFGDYQHTSLVTLGDEFSDYYTNLTSI